MRSRILSLLCLGIFALPGIVRSQGDEDSLGVVRKAYVASRLYVAAQQYFAHWDDVPGLDLDEAYQEYLQEALSANDRKTFSLACYAFLVRLGNSHTGFSDQSFFDDAGNPQPLSVRYLDGRWTVTKSEIDELHPGDVLSHIDGIPFEQFYKSKSRYLSASTERHRRRRLFSSWYRYHFPLRYTLTLENGTKVAIDRSGEEKKLRPLETTGKWLADGVIGYIHVPSWNDKKFQERALELLEGFKNAKGLIIDVRGNNGGSSPITFTRALMERPWKWWAESTPMSFSLFSYHAGRGRSGFYPFIRPSMSWPSEIQQGDSLYKGPLVILVDEATHSASEDFTMPFKENGRATIIGNATAGSTGQPYTERLGDRMRFSVGAKREFFPDGSRFEGVGIAPDILILPRPEELRDGKDVELEKAVTFLKERLSTGE
jgi:carboxyl-terminal processing protease